MEKIEPDCSRHPKEQRHLPLCSSRGLKLGGIGVGGFGGRGGIGLSCTMRKSTCCRFAKLTSDVARLQSGCNLQEESAVLAE